MSSWATRQHKKIYAAKVAKQAMESKEYKESQKISERISMMMALGVLAYTTCDYLEMQFGCKKNGMLNYLHFLGLRLKEIFTDEEYFVDCEKRYKEEYGLNVPNALDLDSFSDPEYIKKIYEEANL